MKEYVLKRYEEQFVMEEIADFGRLEPTPSLEEVRKMLESTYDISHLAEENLFMIAFDTRFRPLGIVRVSKGTFNSSLCNPREIFAQALLLGATGIILAHNHPTGDAKLSREDKAVAKRINEAGKLLDVKLVDFIVLGEKTVSAQAMGLL